MNVMAVLPSSYQNPSVLPGKVPSKEDGIDIKSGNSFDGIDAKRTSSAVDAVNKKLESAPTQVAFFFDVKSNRIWLNVIDKASGKIVSEIPPESIRKIVDGYATSGLNVDKLR